MSHSGRVARNTLANWIGVATGTLVLFFLTPYLVRVLGDERFGIYAIANQSIVYVNLLALGMRGAVTRFASRAIAAGNLTGLNATLSSISLFYLLIGVAGFLVCTLLGVFAPGFFEIDAAYAGETRVLFLGVGFGFAASLMGLIYGGVLVGHQRYDLLNAGSIVRDLTRGGLIVLAFLWGWQTLGAVAVAVVAAQTAALICLWRLGHHQQPGLAVTPRWGTIQTRREILGLSGWNGLIQIGNVVTFATPIFIVGKVFGAAEVALYMIPFYLVDRLRIVVAGMANTLSPMAASTLVTGDREHFRTLLVQGTRAAAMICFPVGALMLVLGEPFLALYLPGWSARQAHTAWSVCAVLLISMFGRISQAPTLHVLIGGGKLKGLAIVQVFSATATVLLTIVWATQTSMGVVGVAAGVTIPLLLSHSLFLPAYAARQMGVSVWGYLARAYGGPVVSTLPGLLVAIGLSSTWPATSWSRLIGEAALASVVMGILAWFRCVDRSIRQRVWARISGN